MAVKPKKKDETPKGNPDKACFDGQSESCPFNSGKNSPYMYQLGCRGDACRTANREYYRAWRASKVRKTVPVKKTKLKAKKAGQRAKK